MDQPRWKTVWKFLKKVKIELPYEAANPLEKNHKKEKTISLPIHRKERILLSLKKQKTLESHLDSKEIKPDNSKGIQHWIFIGRAYAEAEAPILWPPDATSQLI